MRSSGDSRTTHAGHATHTAEVGEVLLGSLVLLVLVNPLVEVGLEELQLLGLLEQARPVLLLELLLAQFNLDIARGVVDLAVLDVDLAVEGELEVVGGLLGVGQTLEVQAVGLKVQLEVLLLHVRDDNGEVDEVLLGIRVGRALGPEDCWERKLSQPSKNLDDHGMALW